MTTRSESLLHYLRGLMAPAEKDAGDAVLLERFASHGDESAFTTLLARHGPMVLGVCRRILRNDPDAEDVFQATFLVLARKAGTLRRPQALAAWLYGTAHHLASKARRAESRRRQREAHCLEHTVPASPGELLDDLSARELLVALDEELARLPEAYRLPLILCHLEGRTHEEAGRLLGWTAGSVKGRLERGRKQLHARLRCRGLTLGAGLLAMESMATTTLSAVLRQATAQQALTFASGSAEGIAASVLALAETSITSMTMMKAKVGLILLLALGLAGGAGVLAYPLRSEKQAEEKKTNEKGRPQALEPPTRIAETKPTNAQFQKNRQPRLDLHGDPLPEGAISRLGTVRLCHGGPVTCLLYSPDSKTVISGGGTETIRIWDVNSGKEIRHFVVPQRKMPAGKRIDVSTLALSSDGETMAAGTTDGSIYLWDIASGKLLHVCQGDQGHNVASVAFSRNGKVLASCGGFADKRSQVRLWDVATGKELRRFPVEVHCLYSAVFSPVSDTLAVSGDATIVIMDAATGKVQHKLRGHCNVITSIAFSRDGKTVASGEAGRPTSEVGRNVRVWSVETGKQLHFLRGRQDFVWAVAFGADGVLAAAHDGVCFWDSHSGKHLRHLSGFWGEGACVRSLAFSPDGKTLACGNGAGVITFCDVGTATQVRRMTRHDAGLNSLALSPDGRTLATASDDRSVGLWDVASAKQLRKLTGHNDCVRFVAFSPNGKLLASADKQGVILWDRATGAELRRFKGCCMAFSPDGKQIACGGVEDENRLPGIIRLHDLETGKVVRCFLGHKAGVQYLAFSPDGKTLASASWGTLYHVLPPGEYEVFPLRLWDVASGRECCHFAVPHKFPASILTFSPDGRLLVTVHGFSSQMDVWEAATGKQRRVLDLKELVSVASVLFLPDGRTLAVGSSSGEIDFLDLATGKELSRVCGHYNAVNCLALSPDAKTLFSGSADTTALVWDLPSLFTPLRNGLVPVPGGGVDSLWADLASADAAKADRAIWTLTASPQTSISFLKDHLRPAVNPEAERLDKLIADLDSDSFAVREKATQELEKHGEALEGALRKLLEGRPSAEVRQRVKLLLEKMTGANRLRRLRAVEVLEHLNTAESRRLLERLAGGAPGASLTQEAKASLARLAARSASRRPFP